MKRPWEIPSLEVLDVSETMKGWKPGSGGGGEDKNPQEPEDLFDS